MDKHIIGRKDRADLPDFDLEDVAVKTDSGAYSCSIDCMSIQLVEKNGKELLEVVFLDEKHPKHTGEKIYFDTFRKKGVRSSTGHFQERFIIKCHIRLFGKDYLTDFSLTRRKGMKNPILLGRKLLNKRFLIDTSKVNLSHNQKSKK